MCDTRFGCNSAATSPSGSTSCDMRNAPTGSFLSGSDISDAAPAAATSASTAQPFQRPRRAHRQQIQRRACASAAASASCAPAATQRRRALRQQLSDVRALRQQLQLFQRQRHQRSAALFSYSSLSDSDDGAAPAAVTSVAFDMRPLASQKQLRQRCVQLPQHPLP